MRLDRGWAFFPRGINGPAYRLSNEEREGYERGRAFALLVSLTGLALIIFRSLIAYGSAWPMYAGFACLAGGAAFLIGVQGGLGRAPLLDDAMRTKLLGPQAQAMPVSESAMIFWPKMILWFGVLGYATWNLHAYDAPPATYAALGLLALGGVWAVWDWFRRRG